MANQVNDSDSDDGFYVIPDGDVIVSSRKELTFSSSDDDDNHDDQEFNLRGCEISRDVLLDIERIISNPRVSDLKTYPSHVEEHPNILQCLIKMFEDSNTAVVAAKCLTLSPVPETPSGVVVDLCVFSVSHPVHVLTFVKGLKDKHRRHNTRITKLIVELVQEKLTFNIGVVYGALEVSSNCDALQCTVEQLRNDAKIMSFEQDLTMTRAKCLEVIRCLTDKNFGMPDTFQVEKKAEDPPDHPSSSVRVTGLPPSVDADIDGIYQRPEWTTTPTADEGQAEEDNYSDVAVIGVGCRFPGANNLEEFWRVLSNGEDHIKEITSDRWVVEDFYDADPKAGKSYTNKAGFISNFADFDHKLFGISQTEAGQMDPQQRQVLECTYMALENAGITIQQISGQKVGVFIGCMNTDYAKAMLSFKDMVDQYSVAGLASSVISNRVSYIFNLTGPSMTIDTACSSSLVAIHQAINALKTGDCSLAICGGVSLLLHPDQFNSLSKAEMLSPNGRSHAFASTADGYTRGEGCGIVILKPMQQAESDCDNIWGTVVTGVNQDGHFAQPITAPSLEQQENLLKDVFSKNKIDPSSVQVIEAHGTGTKKGDPVEANAFGSFFAEHGKQRSRFIGSVKTNIGHLEPAAGVAGLIKVLLMMKHNTIVQSLHFVKPNELIAFDQFQFTVPTKCFPWEDKVKVACLNSFGFGGANSHAVVKSVVQTQNATQTNGTFKGVVCFSGNTFKGLEDSLRDFLATEDCVDLPSIVYTSISRREHFKFRKMFIVESLEMLKDKVGLFLSGEPMAKRRTQENAQIVFMFCGMGTAWSGMCKDWLLKYDVFQQTMSLIDKSLKRFVSWSLLGRLKESFDVEDSLFGPIATFATQVSLSSLWMSWGIMPVLVIGQSVGEIAAAHIAGILSLDEAVKVIYHRSNILAAATGGKMLFIRNLQTHDVEKRCDAYTGKLSVALYYSHVSCTVSGDFDAVEDMRAELHRENPAVDVMDLKMPRAFHSHHMDPCRKQLDAVLTDLKTEEPSIPMISTVDSSYGSTDIKAPSYWGQNLRQPVKLYDAIVAVKEKGSAFFIEIGPHPVLQAHMEDIYQGEQNTTTLTSMRRKGTGSEILESLAVLFENNKDINWKTFIDDPSLPPAPIPRYSFEPKTLWKLEPLSNEVMGRTISTDHLFVRKSRDAAKCTMDIRPSQFSTVFEHKVNNVIVIPGATYAETGFSVAKLTNLGNIYNAEVSVNFSSPVTLQIRTSTELDVLIEQKSTSESAFKVTKGEVTHAEGSIVIHNIAIDEERIDLEAIQQRCQQRVEGADVYEMLKQSGFTYGSNFATIDHAFKGDREALAVLKLSSQLQNEMKYTHLHPAVLDALLQIPTVVHFQKAEFLPVELCGVTLRHQLTSDLIAYTKLTHVSNKRTSFFLCLLSPDGTIVARVNKYVTEIYDKSSFDPKQATYMNTWIKMNPKDDENFDLEDIVLVTNMKSNCFPSQMKLTTLDKISASESSALEGFNSRAVCFAFPLPDAHHITNGKSVVDELYRRIAALRSIVLFLVNKNYDVPVVVLMEERETDDPYGVETAGSCLNEAVAAFCRCVQREYRNPKLTSLVVNVSDGYEYISLIPQSLKTILSAEMKNVSDIKITSQGLITSELIPRPQNAPIYRYSRRTEFGVLCSKTEKKVYDPSLILKHTRPSSEKTDEKKAKLKVTIAVLHSSKLHTVTVPSDTAFGITEDNCSPRPVLTLEAICKLEGDTGETLVCYPSQIQEHMSVPKRCTLGRARIPSYEPGDLLKLYVLWSMCREADKSSVAITYLPSTESIARAISCMLKSLHVKNISLINLEDEDVGQQHAKTLLSTTSMTEYRVTSLCKSLKHLKTVVLFESITGESTLYHFKSDPKLRVVNLCTSDIFSPRIMFTVAAAMISWIKHKKKTVGETIQHLHQLTFPQLPSHVKPINLTEILHTREFTFSSLATMSVPEKYIISKRNSYLVVGGLTGLGWECVSYLASKEAGEVIIFNRRAPDEERKEDMQRLKKCYGCHVKHIQVDVTKHDELKASLNQLKARFRLKTLAGVFYGAGVLLDGSLLDLSEERFKASLLPKVAGSWDLHCLLKGSQPEIFLLHSSSTSLLGNPGQANYGAGNGFLDGLANSRRRTGLSGQSVNWGPLHLGMLENNYRLITKLERAGYDTIERKDVAMCLSHILLVNEPQIAMIRINRRKMAESLVLNQEETLLARLQNFLKPVLKGSSKVGSVVSIDMEKVRRSSSDEAMEMLQDYLKNVACNEALLDDDSYDMTAEMGSHGVDSMNAMQISGQVLKETGVQLSGREIQIQSTIALAKLMVNRIFALSEISPADYDSIVHKTAILKSIAASFFWFDVNDTNMAQILKCTIKVPDTVTTTLLIGNIKGFMSKHRLSRSTLSNDSSLDLNVLDVDEAFDFQELTATDKDEIQIPINLKTHAPLKFFFNSDTQNLVIHFHKFIFDINSIRIFVAHMQGITGGREEETEDPDVAEEIQKVVVPKHQSLRAFWRTSLIHTPTTDLVFKRTGKPPGAPDDIVVARILEKAIFMKFTNFTTKNNLTPFEYFVSMYQVVLCLLSESTSSVVTTSFDMRSSIPVLIDAVRRCTNLVPLICQNLGGYQTLLKFLNGNKGFIEQFLEHGILPFETIKDLMSDDNVRLVSKHLFVFEDDSMTTTNNELLVEQTVAFPVGSESLIYAWYRKKTQTLEFKLHLNSSFYTTEHGEIILDKYLDLLRTSLEYPDIRVSELLLVE